MASQPIRAVFFDLGDTLVHYGDADRRRLFMRGAQRTYALWAARQSRMPGFRRYYLHQWHALRWGLLKVMVMRRDVYAMRYLRRACRKLALEAPEAFFSELTWQWYQPLVEVATIEAETHGMLDDLRAAGYTLGIISNTFVPGFALDRHLGQLGLIDYFPHRVYSCDVGLRKPGRRIFRAALDAAGSAADEAVFVGDVFKTDICGARNAGLHAVWKRRPDCQPDEQSLQIRRLGELPAVIERIQGN